MGIPTLVEAARIYRLQTRREPGNLRCDFTRSLTEPGAFVLWEVFRDPNAQSVHAASAHAQTFNEALSAHVVGNVLEEQLESLFADAVPPPLPLRGRPALESSNPFRAPPSSEQEPWSKRLPQVVVDVEAIEVASAKDHVPLRAAQPCIVLGAFVVGDDGVHGIGRSVYRFTAPDLLPGTLKGVQRLLDAPLLRAQSPLLVAVIAISVEENGGKDVQALYQMLADGRDLSFWTDEGACPAPLTLADGREIPALRNRAERVHMSHGVRALADSLHDDTWAGAALGYFELTRDRSEHLARFHTAADNRKNDWLLTLRCKLS